MNRCAPVAIQGIMLWSRYRYTRAMVSKSQWLVKPNTTRNSFPSAKWLSDAGGYWGLSQHQVSLMAALDVFQIVFFHLYLYSFLMQKPKTLLTCKNITCFSVTCSEYRIYFFFRFARITVMLLKVVFYTGMAD